MSNHWSGFHCVRALESTFKQVILTAQPDSEASGKMVESAVSNMDVGLGAMKAMEDEDEGGEKKNKKGGKKVNESSGSGNANKLSVRTPQKTKAKAVEWSGLMQELTKECLDCQRRLKAATDDGKIRFTGDMQKALKDDAAEITALKNRMDQMYSDDASENEIVALMNEAAGKFEQAWVDMEAARERLGEKNKANSHHSHHWVLPKVR